MESVRQYFEQSIFYRWLMYLINQSQKSFFFKLDYKVKTFKDKSVFHYTGYVRLFSWMGNVLDRLVEPMIRSIQQSFSVKTISSLWTSLKNKSVFFRWVAEFRWVYLLAVFAFVDYFVRYIIGIPVLSSYWDELFLIFMVGKILLHRIYYKKKYVFTSLDLPILFYVAIGIILVSLNSPELDVAIEGFRAVYQYIFWYFIVVQLLEDKKTVYRMIKISMIGMSILGLHGIYQFATGARMLGNWVDSSETVRTRAYSIVFSPNVYGSIFVLGIPIGLGLFFAEKNFYKKVLFLFGTVFMGMGMLFSLSRGAWLMAFIGVMIFFLATYRRYIVVGLTMVCAAIVNIRTIYERVANLLNPDYIAKSSNGGRLSRWKMAIEAWQEEPFLGQGLGRYGGSVATNNKITSEYADNYMIKTLAEMGLVGVIAYVILLLITLYKLVLGIFSIKGERDQILLLGVFSGLIGVIGHNFVENIFETPFMTSFFWIHVAIIISFIGLDRKEQHI